MEKWEKIKCVKDDRYEISNYGRARSWAVYGGKKGAWADHPRILSQYDHKSGHKIIGLRVDGITKQVRVHRLVAKAFIPNPKNYPHVLHYDDNPANNYVENLRWGNDKMNQKDRRRNNGCHNEGENHGMSILTENQVIDIKKRIYNTNDFYKDIAYDYNVSEGTIRSIKDGKSWAYIKLPCEDKPIPKRKMTLSKHHMAKKFRHKKTGKIFDSGKEAAIWAKVNYGTMIGRINRNSPKAQFDKL